MQQDLKDKWIEALLSGKYKQGQASLRLTLVNGKQVHCCLGVLCDILGPNGWSKSCDGDGHPHKSNRGEYLSDEALSLIGMTRAQQQKYYELNDNGWTFKVIAEDIKKDL
jgi:hypothetical protein